MNWRLNLSARVRMIAVLGAVLSLAACDSPEERAQAYYESGKQFMDKGELVKASLEFRNALKIREDFVEPLFALGQIEQREGRIVKAVRIFMGVAERDPKHLQSRVNLASVMMVAGELDQAQKYIDQALQIAPKDPQPMALKAGLLLKQGQTDEALQLADEALAIQPGHAEALMVKAAERLSAKDPAEALAVLSKGGEDTERNLGFQLIRMEALNAAGDRSAIDDTLRRMVANFPDNGTMRIALVRWLASTDRMDEAEDALREAVERFPDKVEYGLTLVSFVNRMHGEEAAGKQLDDIIAKTGLFDYQMVKVRALNAKGERDQAKTLLNKLIDEHKDTSQADLARVELANLAAADQDIAGAETILSQILERDGKQVDALRERAAIRLDAGRLDEAITDLTQALNEAPESVPLLLLTAKAREEKGTTDLAEEALFKAVKVANYSLETSLPLVEFLLRYRKFDPAERVLNEALQVNPSSRELLTALAGVRLQKGNGRGAEELATRLRNLQGDKAADADAILAAALSAQGKYDESLQVLQSIAGSNATGPQQMAALVQGYLRADKADEAKAFLASLLKDDPANTRALVLMGGVYESESRSQEAAASYMEAVAKSPDNPLGYRALGGFQLRANKLDEAEQIAREGLARHKDDAALQLVLAETLERAGRFDEAIGTYEALYAAQPLSPLLANNLASLLSDHAKDEQALDRAMQIAERFKNSQVPQFRDTLGWIYHLKGDHERAVGLLKSAAEELPDLEAVQYHLGVAYKALGRPELAMDALTKAQKLAEAQGLPTRAEVADALRALEATASVGKSN